MLTALEAAHAEIARLRIEIRRLEMKVAELSPTIVSLDSLNVPVVIKYQDAQGQISQRTVTVHQLECFTDGRPYAIKGFCHLRKATRNFVLAQVVQASDPEIGEIIPQIVSYLWGKT